MSHKALARKYRPRSFADVATQGHVSETLLNAVATDRVGHAYLFCGPRGVGKTTVARVLAMALNCADRAESGEPCGVCESCARIWGGHTALDVVEIDAASNRGVDDARDLRERAMYAPSAEGRSKVYIVDEAHMLTREAWNALLKILEEPPPSVIFVFATTEPQKIQQAAAPILSRCQRFDFRRIGVADIVARLEDVLDREGVAYQREALRLVARKADGGMRDALSLLDQVLSLTGGEVDPASVRRVLGLVEEERYLELLDIVSEGRHADVFSLVQTLVDEGYDLVEFHHGLLDLLRTVLRLRLSADADVDVEPELRGQLADRAERFEPGDLVRMLTAAADLESQGSLRRSPNPRVPIEMLLLRMSFLDRTVGVEELIQALGGAPKPGPGGRGNRAPGDGAGSSARSAPSPPQGVRSGGAGFSPRASAESAPERAAPPSQAGPGTTAASPDDSGEATGEPDLSESTGVGSAGPPEGPAAEEGPLSAQLAWARWLADGRGVPRGLGTFLRAADVREDEDGTLVVSGLPEPALERLADATVLDAVRRGLQPYLGQVPALRVGSSEPSPNPPGRTTRTEVREDMLRALFRQEPRLERAVEELDLELMD